MHINTGMASVSVMLQPGHALPLKQKVEKIWNNRLSLVQRSWTKLRTYSPRRPKSYHLVLYTIIFLLLLTLITNRSRTKSNSEKENDVRKKIQHNLNRKDIFLDKIHSIETDVISDYAKILNTIKPKFSSPLPNETNPVKGNVGVSRQRTNSRRGDTSSGVDLAEVINPHDFPLLINNPTLCTTGNKVSTPVTRHYIMHQWK